MSEPRPHIRFRNRQQRRLECGFQCFARARLRLPQEGLDLRPALLNRILSEQPKVFARMIDENLVKTG